MPFKSKQKRADYMREYHRRMRSGQQGAGVVAFGSPSEDKEWRAESLKDLLRIETETLNELRATEMDVAVKSRAVAQNVSVALRIVELMDIEAGIEKVDEAIKAKKGKAPARAAEWQAEAEADKPN
jgi:hypothetical protein